MKIVQEKEPGEKKGNEKNGKEKEKGEAAERTARTIIRLIAIRSRRRS